MSAPLLTLLAAISTPADATEIRSATSGDWSNPATWTGGVVPGPGDDVIIANRHSVVVDASAPDSVATLGGNSLTLTLGRDFTVTDTLYLRESVFNDGGYDLAVDGLLTNSAVPSCSSGNTTIWNRTGGVMTLGTLCLKRLTGLGMRPGDVINGDWISERIYNTDPNTDITQDEAHYANLDEGLSLEGESASVDLGTTVITLNWNASLDGEVDWILRWRGDHVDAVRGLFTSGNLAVGTVPSGEEFDAGANVLLHDGYTWVAFLLDGDGDGVGDILDACPEEDARGDDADGDGCIDDGDGDGVPDSADQCPFEDSTGYDVDGDGCIDDTDGDTWFDDVDECPEEAAEDNNGCPEEEEEEPKDDFIRCSSSPSPSGWLPLAVVLGLTLAGGRRRRA